jgi:cytochrome c-type biogenesis protein CcmH/NrfF
VQLTGTGGGERDPAGALVGRIGRDLREPKVLKLPDLLWIAPVIIVVLWIAIQLGLGYRHRHHGA